MKKKTCKAQKNEKKCGKKKEKKEIQKKKHVAWGKLQYFPMPFRVLLIIEFCAISFNNYEVNNEICDVDR